MNYPDWLNKQYADLWEKLPEHMHGYIDRYVDKGLSPGGFLSAALRNDLEWAMAKADDINRVALYDWVKFFHNAIPANAHGSPDNFNAWVRSGGLVGQNGDEDQNDQS